MQWFWVLQYGVFDSVKQSACKRDAEDPPARPIRHACQSPVQRGVWISSRTFFSLSPYAVQSRWQYMLLLSFEKDGNGEATMVDAQSAAQSVAPRAAISWQRMPPVDVERKRKSLAGAEGEGCPTRE